MISCVQAPRLEAVPTYHFIEFKRLREIYEKQVEEEGRQPKEEIIPTLLRESIGYDDISIS